MVETSNGNVSMSENFSIWTINPEQNENKLPYYNQNHCVVF